MTGAGALEAREPNAGDDAATYVVVENPEMGSGDPAVALDPAPDDTPAIGPDDSLAYPGPSTVQSSEQATLRLFERFDDGADDDVPFDPPDPEDFAAPPALEAGPEVEAQRAVAPKKNLSPPPRPLSTPRALHRSEIQPSGRAYLAAARVAALEHARRNSRTGLRHSSIAQSIMLGLALPLLLGGVWVLTEPPEGAPVRQMSPGPAAAAPAPAAPPASISAHQRAVERKAEYDAAMRQIAAGGAEAAIAVLRRLAEDGYPMAQYRLSKLYENGAGAPRNLSLALHWAERAAREGNISAMHDVGVYYAQGEGAPLNETTAFRWFREAAAFGVADSQHNLAILYEQGRGVDVNPMEALFWYLVAARCGDANAADRAVGLAAQATQSGVEQARARARAFQAREPDAAANGA